MPRIVSWNIRHGGGKNATAISDQLLAWRPDAVILCEFRGTPPSQGIAERLADAGLHHQSDTVDRSAPATNSLLLAARQPVERLGTRRVPVPRRFLPARIDAFSLTVIAAHVPNRNEGNKYEMHDYLLRYARRHRGTPGVLIGDTNTGEPDLDEELPVFNRREAGWFQALRKGGWTDTFRHLYGERREYTWHGPRLGTGYRLDQAFLNAEAMPRLEAMRYDWGDLPRGRLSDHAAVILDLYA